MVDSSGPGQTAVSQKDETADSSGPGRRASLRMTVTGSEQLPLPRRAAELVAEVRVGALDQGESALAEGLPEEVGDAVLRHHVVDVGPARHHARALAERVHDARDLP